MPLKFPLKKTKIALHIFFLFLANHLFLAFLAMLFVAVIVAAGIFYRYAFPVASNSVPTPNSQIHFQEKALLEVFQEQTSRAEQFQKVDEKQYRNIFETIPSFPPESLEP